MKSVLSWGNYSKVGKEHEPQCFLNKLSADHPVFSPSFTSHAFNFQALRSSAICANCYLVSSVSGGDRSKCIFLALHLYLKLLCAYVPAHPLCVSFSGLDVVVF